MRRGREGEGMMTTIEQHRLSDGGLAYIEKIGRRYMFGRTYPDMWQEPDAEHNLTLDEARSVLAIVLSNDARDNDF
jgi:hypothetical protein